MKTKIFLLFLFAIPLIAQSNKLIRESDLKAYYDSTYFTFGGANLEPELVVTPAESKIVMDVDSVRIRGDLQVNGVFESPIIGYRGSHTNVAVGDGSLATRLGSQNVALGLNALHLSEGVYNIAIGANTMTNDIDGVGNVAIGSQALSKNISGWYNTAIGYNAGMYYGSNSFNTSPSNGIYIGWLSKASADNLINEIVIGNTTVGNGSNTVTLGGSTISATYLYGNVNIGGGLTTNDYTFPPTDGSAGTTIKTDGNGNLYWGSDIYGGGGGSGSDTASVLYHLSRYVTADSFATYAEGLARYQPLETTLTDIADGTIVENLVNTTNPWSDNEVANDLTIDATNISSSITRDSEVTKELLGTNGDISDGTITNGDDNTLPTEDDVYDFVIAQGYSNVRDSNFVLTSETSAWDKNASNDLIYTDTTAVTGKIQTKYQSRNYITDGNTLWNNSYGFITNTELLATTYTSANTFTVGSGTGAGANKIALGSTTNTVGATATIKPSVITSNITLTLPATTGTLALTSQIEGDTLDYTATQLNTVMTNLTGGTTGQVLKKTSSIAEYAFGWANDTGGGGVANVVEDVTPQLGGDLDLNDKSLVNTSPTYTVTATELGYLDNVTSAIQTQFNALYDSIRVLREYIKEYVAVTDTFPDVFTFTDVTGANLSTAKISNSIPLKNFVGTIYPYLKDPVAGDSLRIKHSNVWGIWKRMATAVDGDSAQVKLTTSGSYNVQKSVMLVASNKSDTYSVTTLTDAAPSAPTSLLAGGISTSSITATWTDPADADKDSVRIYRASYADSTNFTWIASVDEGVQTYTNSGLSSNSAYWYKLKTKDDGGNLSAYSNRDSAKTFSSGTGIGTAFDSSGATYAGYDNNGWGLSGWAQIGARITPSTNRTIGGVGINIIQEVGNTDTISFVAEVRVASGNDLGTVVATSTPHNGLTVGWNNTFVFSSSVTLNSGTTYFILVRHADHTFNGDHYAYPAYGTTMTWTTGEQGYGFRWTPAGVMGDYYDQDCYQLRLFTWQ